MGGSPEYEFYVIDSCGVERIFRADGYSYCGASGNLTLFCGEDVVAVFNGISSFRKYESTVSVEVSE